MAILSYGLSDAVGLNPDGSRSAHLSVTVNYDSVLLTLTSVHIINATSADRTVHLGAFSVTAPANTDASYASPSATLAMASARGLLRPPSHAT